MNWFRKQNPRRVNQDQESIYIGFATAVAAAAFAVHSHEEAEALKIKNGNKKADTIAKLSHPSEVTGRFSFKKTKNGGEALTRQSTIKNHVALEKTYSARKPPMRSSSNKLKAPEGDARGNNDRNDKLKSLIAWANIKKIKTKSNTQSKKD